MSPSSNPPANPPRSEPAAPSPEALLEMLGLAAVLLDSERRIRTMNGEAERLLRLSLATVKGRSLESLRLHMPPLEKLCQRAGEERRSITLREAQWTDATGAEKRIDLRVTPTTTETSEPCGFMVLIEDRSLAHDATASAQTEDQLATMASISAGIAHEVKNPLGGIRGAAQLIQGRAGDAPEIEECTGLIIRETDRIARLVDNLMSFTRPGGHLRTEEFNIHQAIDEALQVIEKDLHLGMSAVERFYDPSLPGVTGHFDSLKQCFLNLAKNAMEAMADLPEDAFRLLTVTTRYQTGLRQPIAGVPRGPLLVIEFRDRGMGLSKELEGHMFQPFRTTKPKGMGLGLATCRKIVHDHSGRIQLSNAPGGGTLARILLPLNPATKEGAAIP